MRERLSILLVTAILMVTAMTLGAQVNTHRKIVSPDSVVVQPLQDFGGQHRRKMSSSAFPVQIQVIGKSVKLQSEHNQILPIYNQSGGFYMVMRLSKGTNWLNGLPKGRYFINNRPITIN